MENERPEKVTLYRGGCRTGDKTQPVIWTAVLYATDREAVRAIRRAARACGYNPTRLQLFAAPHVIGEPADFDDQPHDFELRVVEGDDHE